jgi:hypothetical protein
MYISNVQIILGLQLAVTLLVVIAVECEGWARKISCLASMVLTQVLNVTEVYLLQVTFCTFRSTVFFLVGIARTFFFVSLFIYPELYSSVPHPLEFILCMALGFGFVELGIRACFFQETFLRWQEENKCELKDPLLAEEMHEIDKV